MVHRRHFIAGAGAAALAASTTPVTAQPSLTLFGDLKNGQFGADLSGVDFEGVLEALDPAALKGTSLEVLNPANPNAGAVVLDNLPTVSTQGVPGSVGDPGSCEAQSFGYCLGAYTAARQPNGQRKWSAGEAGNQPSCAWLYEWQHADDNSKACPAGSMAVPYVQKLIATGAPSTAQFPYNPTGATTPRGVCAHIGQIDVSNLGPHPGRMILGSYKGYSGVQHQEATYLETFKSLIRGGHAIAFSGLVPNAYCIESPPLNADAFTAPQGFITNSGHGQVIVGFDDSKGPRGAFLVQNSFGPNWNPGPGDDAGHNGRIWYGYGAWFAGQSFALIAFPNLDEPPTGVRLDASNGGAPALFVKESSRYMQGGNSYLAVILHADDAVTVNQLDVIGPMGMSMTQSLNEMIRFGYAYVERKAPFRPGRYTARITAQTQSGQSVTYTGDFPVS
jgi:hypothetical protein